MPERFEEFLALVRTPEQTKETEENGTDLNAVIPAKAGMTKSLGFALKSVPFETEELFTNTETGIMVDFLYHAATFYLKNQSESALCPRF
jgi:hypothetical protein